MRKSGEMAGRLGDLQNDIELNIFKYIKRNKALEDEYFTIDGGQVHVYYGEDNKENRCMMMSSKQSNYIYEGIRPLRTIPIEKELDILEQIENLLRID